MTHEATRLDGRLATGGRAGRVTKKKQKHHSLESSESYPSTSGSSSLLTACGEAVAPAHARSGLSSLGRSLSAVDTEVEGVERGERSGPTWGAAAGRPRGYRGK